MVSTPVQKSFPSCPFLSRVPFCLYGWRFFVHQVFVFLFFLFLLLIHWFFAQFYYIYAPRLSPFLILISQVYSVAQKHSPSRSPTVPREPNPATFSNVTSALFKFPFNLVFYQLAPQKNPFTQAPATAPIHFCSCFLKTQVKIQSPNPYRCLLLIHWSRSQ